MMSMWFLLTLSFLFAQTADHATFKDCSRVPFCSTLRTQEPEEKYVVNFLSLKRFKTSESVELTLTSTDGSDNLVLTITALEDDTIRIKIKETDSTRYELQDVLDGEPSPVAFDNVEQQDQRLVLEFSTNKIVVTSPFNIEIYKDNTIEFIFEGNRLIFNKSLDQVFAFGVAFPAAFQLYGIHEHADTLALQSTRVGGTDPYRLRNLDVAGYELNSPMALYGAVPVLYGHGPQATAGIFIHNAAEQWIETTNGENKTEAYVMVESGTLDIFVLLGPSPTEVVRQYVKLTGTAHLPQLWALGYHQCRWNYVSQEDLKEVVANFNNFNFPLDVIWLDIDYTDGKKYFTWDASAFGDPVEMQQNISASHKRLVTIIDPHIKVEEGYNVYDGALENDLFVKTANGTAFEGDCWPGLSSYMDFLNPSARSYYASFYSYEKFPYSTPTLAGIWNDMNEPSVFDNSIEKTLPNDAVHHGGVLHRDIHNIYGLLHTMSTHQGLIDRDSSATRPFVLTRSHFAGTQRYSAIWTRDNTADWGYLSTSYAECLNANILGIVFCGADVGGFSNDPDVELLQRWYQAGVWLPFYRAHANSGTQRREPYLFAEDVQAVIRNALELRYHHLPTWYTLFYEHTVKRDPIIRPLFYHYPSDVNVFSLENHLLVGRDILVRAVAEPGVESVQVYFPGGPEEQWFSIINSDVYDGSGFAEIAVDIQAIPVYYRKGSVIVRKDTTRLSSDEMVDDWHTLYVNLDDDDKASGTIYLDDNTSFDYVNNKKYNYLQIDVNSTFVMLTKLDDSDSDGFEFVFEDIVFHQIMVAPKNGKPGKYQKKVFKEDADKKLFKNMKFKVDTTVAIRLE